MVFATPAMFKSGGKVCCFPDIVKYFYSVVCKNNKFENSDVSFDEFCTAFSAGEIKDYRLFREGYNVSGNLFYGMTGYIDYRFPADVKQQAVLKRVFAYATYCGVGGKTGMGMGGFLIA